VHDKIFPLISKIGIAYPDSFLTLKSSIGKQHAGQRIHYFVFSNGRDIFSYLTKPSFKLLFFGTDADNHSDECVGQKLRVELMSFAEIPSAIFGNETNFYVLVRPDNHVSYIGKEIKSCKEFMQKISLDSD